MFGEGAAEARAAAARAWEVGQSFILIFSVSRIDAAEMPTKNSDLTYVAKKDLLNLGVLFQKGATWNL